MPRCQLRRSRRGKLTSLPNAKHALQRLQSNLRCRPSKVARLRWQSRKTKITELEAAANQAAEAVEEAKQKAEKLQGEIDKLQTEYDEEVARFVKPSDPVTHLQKTVREAFQALSGNLKAQPFTYLLETAFTGLSSLLAAATPTPMATDVRDDIDLQTDKGKATSNEAMAVARAFERSLEGLPEDEREAKKAKMVQYVEKEKHV